MGDRRIAQVITDKGTLYVYTHWCGEAFPRMAEAAILASEPRWDDHPYALRIIVDQLTKPGRDRELGFGLLFTLDAEDEYATQTMGRASIIIDLVGKTLTVHEGQGVFENSFENIASRSG